MFQSPNLKKCAKHHNNTLTITQCELSLDDLREIEGICRYLNPQGLKKLEFIDCRLDLESDGHETVLLEQLQKQFYWLKNLTVTYKTKKPNASLVSGVFSALKSNASLKEFAFKSGKYSLNPKLLLDILQNNSTLESLSISVANEMFPEEVLPKLEEAILSKDTLHTLDIKVGIMSSSGIAESTSLGRNYQGKHPACLAISEKLSRNFCQHTHRSFTEAINQVSPDFGDLKNRLEFLIHTELLPPEKKHEVFRKAYQRVFGKAAVLFNIFATHVRPFTCYLYRLLSVERGALYQSLNLHAFHQEFMSPVDALQRLESELKLNLGKIEAADFSMANLLLEIKIQGIAESKIEPDFTFALQLLFRLFDEPSYVLPNTSEFLRLLEVLISNPKISDPDKGRIYEKMALVQTETSVALHYFHLACDCGHLEARVSLRLFYHQLSAKTLWTNLAWEIVYQAIEDGFHEFKLILAYKLSLGEEALELLNKALIRACIAEGIEAVYQQQLVTQELFQILAQFIQEWLKHLSSVELEMFFHPSIKEKILLLTKISGAMFSLSDKTEDRMSKNHYGASFTIRSLFFYLHNTTHLNAKEKSSMMASLLDEINKRSEQDRLKNDPVVMVYLAYREPGVKREDLLRVFTGCTVDSSFQNAGEIQKRIQLFLDDSDLLFFRAESKLIDRKLFNFLANICLIERKLFRPQDLETLVRLLSQLTLDHFACLALNNNPQGIRVFKALETIADDVFGFLLREENVEPFRENRLAFSCYLMIYLIASRPAGFDFSSMPLWKKIANPFIVGAYFPDILTSDDKTFIQPHFLEKVCMALSGEKNKTLEQYLADGIEDSNGAASLVQDSETLRQYLSTLKAPPAPSAPAPGTMTLLSLAEAPTPSAPPPGTQTLANFVKQQAPATRPEKLGNTHSPIIPYAELNLGERIAQGGQGDVHRAKWNGMEVAVKVIRNFSQDPVSANKLYSESQILSRLRHPSIVTFYGYTDPREPVQFCMVMEYYEKGSLSDYIHASEQWDNPLSWRIRCALEVNQGLAYLHEQNILHLDVKAANALLTTSWHCKLGDFGISKTLQTLQSQQTTVNLNGTPSHMGPELISHTQGPIQHTSMNDVYSFGIFLWSCVAQSKPFDNWPPFQIMFQVAQHGTRPEIPAGTPPKIADLIQRCWSQKPEQRPKTKSIDSELQSIFLEISNKQEELRPIKRA